MKIQRNKVIKSRSGWQKADQVRRIKIVMTVVAVALCLSVAAGSVLAWMQLRHPFGTASSSSAVPSSMPVSSGEETLPVYDDTYNLTLVNSSHPLEPEFVFQPKEYQGILVDERIFPALEKMMQDAEKDGCPLKLSGGYVSADQQDKQYQSLVESLKKQGMSQVRAENQAQNTVGRGGYNEFQTGMAVVFSAEGEKSDTDFKTTAQYRWLNSNSIRYGFVLRFPQDKTEITGRSFNPRCFRYVGEENAEKMREYSMCLEEYASYRSKTAE